MNNEILLIDDDNAVRSFLRLALAAEGWVVVEARSATEAVAKLQKYQPAAILADLDLPDSHGIELVEKIRAVTHCPLLVLVMRGAEANRALSLDAGADDYLTKPFQIADAVSRLRVLTGHGVFFDAKSQSASLAFDLATGVARVKGSDVGLIGLEVALLRKLAQQPGKIVPYKILLELIQEQEGAAALAHLRHVIVRLRQKIGDDINHPQILMAEPGVGYRLILR